jgi:hypothetical protein
MKDLLVVALRVSHLFSQYDGQDKFSRCGSQVRGSTRQIHVRAVEANRLLLGTATARSLTLTSTGETVNYYHMRGV